MSTLFYLPYNLGSASVSALQAQTGGLKIKVHGSHYTKKPNHLVVVWGHGHTPPWGVGINPNPYILNHWSKLPRAINKLEAFKVFKEAGIKTPLWTDNIEEAKQWVKAEYPVFCRTKLSSSEGNGIVVATTVSDVVSAPLYTRRFIKDKEYRVHVFKGEVIDYAQKKLSAEGKANPNRDKFIRNTENGWVFCRNGVVLAEALKNEAIKAVSALGLDFGAVDLADNKTGSFVVFEVNTAPGLEGTTVKRYADAILKYKETLQ